MFATSLGSAAFLLPLAAGFWTWVIGIAVLAGLGMILLVVLGSSRSAPRSTDPQQGAKDTYLRNAEGHDGGDEED